MNKLNISTKLRFIAAIAPAILLIVAAVLGDSFHFFGTDAAGDLREPKRGGARA